MIKCSICKEHKAIYVRPYSGEKLCIKCFLGSIERKSRIAIGKYEMLQKNDRIAVAVSGGKDSISLLHILVKIEKDFPKSSIYAITVDEGINGYRDEAVGITKKNCVELDVELTVVSFDELFGYTMDEIVKKKTSKLTPCAYCGILRRRALNTAAKEIKADKIATAHTLDDEIQTFLLNIVHGNSFRIAKSRLGLKFEHQGLVPRIKPFCEILERESALYAFIKGVVVQEMPCPYADKALRNDIRNTLNRFEEKHPSMKYTIFSSMKRIGVAMEANVAKPQLRNCKRCEEPTTQDLCQPCQILKNLRQ